jgi:PelA/Pel-15E family pectate lyase
MKCENIVARYVRVMTILLFFVSLSACQAQLDITRFWDSSHHWYDIHDQDRVIEPLPNQQQYSVSEIEEIADNILLFQKDNGGWAKNFDMRAMLTKEQKEKVIADKKVLNTTFDNGATHSQLTYLAEVFTITKEEKYKETFLKGLEFVLSCQYENGGWPQKYPDTSGYQKYITFNDGALMGVINLVYNIAIKDPNYLFLSDDLFYKSVEAYEKGTNCILDMQIIEDGKMSVWCQQHDNVTLEPQNARTFEPAAICNGESSGIVMFLMQLKNPSERVINSINNAVIWFEEAAILGIRADRIEAEEVDFQYHKATWDVVAVEDDNAPRIWTRFTELGTHIPLFCRRDGKKVYKLSDVERERRTGYSFYGYYPEVVLQEYPYWLERNNIVK